MILRLKPILDATVGEFENLEIIWNDVLKLDVPALVKEKFDGLRPMACANLPYYITSPILTALLEAECFDSVTVMVQKEVAQRIAAKPGSADYSAFTVFCQYYAEPELLFDVPAHGNHTSDSRHHTSKALPEGFDMNCVAVDAACSGNPGPMEYRGVYLRTGQVIFHFGPVYGTNNIGEFLAIVHALALMKQKGVNMPIYSDSRNAILWVRQKKCKTRLERTPRTEELYLLIERAEKWLKENPYTIPVLKWETRQWGEVPADFGRK